MAEQKTEIDQVVEVVQEYAVRTPTNRIVSDFMSLEAALTWIDAARATGKEATLLTRIRTVAVTEWAPLNPPDEG